MLFKYEKTLLRVCAIAKIVAERQANVADVKNERIIRIISDIAAEHDSVFV